MTQDNTYIFSDFQDDEVHLIARGSTHILFVGRNLGQEVYKMFIDFYLLAKVLQPDSPCPDFSRYFTLFRCLKNAVS